MERSVAEQAQVIKEMARSKTQQVQEQVTKSEPQFVERIDEMRLRTYIFKIPGIGLGRTRKVTKQIPRVEVQFVEKHVSKHSV